VTVWPRPQNPPNRADYWRPRLHIHHWTRNLCSPQFTCTLENDSQLVALDESSFLVFQPPVGTFKHDSFSSTHREHSTTSNERHRRDPRHRRPNNHGPPDKRHPLYVFLPPSYLSIPQSHSGGKNRRVHRPNGRCERLIYHLANSKRRLILIVNLESKTWIYWYLVVL
jgi:hypothetical protein